MFGKIREEYARLVADAQIISYVSDNLPISAVRLYDEIMSLEESNKTAQMNLIKLVADKFPSVLSDIVQMSEQNFRNWILLIQEYPQVLLGQEEKFASLFWSLCNSKYREEGIYFSEMINIAAEFPMLGWVQTSTNQEVAGPYVEQVLKYAKGVQRKRILSVVRRMENNKKSEGK